VIARGTVVAFLCALAVLGAACDVLGGDKSAESSDATPTPGADTPGTAPEEALRLFVERRLSQGFVADCEDAGRPDDVGKQCARFRGERDGLRAYELGPTFGEYTRLIILQPAAGTWSIAHMETRDPSEPPVPGIPWPLRVGATVVVAGTSDCLRVRQHAGTLAPPVTCLDNGTAVTISNGPVDIDTFQWWELEGYGWSASNWLRYPDDTPPARATEPTES
jgi:hypothetical protein